MSSSPQSTLCGVLGSKQGSNSESPNSPFLASSPKEVLSRKGTVDLLYAAVEEVARMKKMEEEVGIWAPPRKTSPVYVDPKMSKPNLGLFYSNQPPLSYHQFQMLQVSFNSVQRLRVPLFFVLPNFLIFTICGNAVSAFEATTVNEAKARSFGSWKRWILAVPVEPEPPAVYSGDRQK